MSVCDYGWNWRRLRTDETEEHGRGRKRGERHLLYEKQVNKTDKTGRRHCAILRSMAALELDLEVYSQSAEAVLAIVSCLTLCGRGSNWSRGSQSSCCLATVHVALPEKDLEAFGVLKLVDTIQEARWEKGDTGGRVEQRSGGGAELLIRVFSGDLEFGMKRYSVV